MGQKTITFFLFLLSMTIFLLSCSDSITSTSETEKAGVETHLKVIPNIVKQGEDFKIEISIIKHGPDTLSLTFGCLQKTHFHVMQGNNNLIYYPVRCYTAMSFLGLLPGEEKIYTYTLSADRGSRSSNISWPNDLDELPLGIYKVVGGLRNYTDEYPWGKATFIVTR